MTLRSEDPEGYERRRRYHRNRAVVRKQESRGSALFVGGMDDAALWREVHNALSALVVHLGEGTDAKALMHGQNAQAAFEELRVRGEQLRLPLG